MRNRRTIGAIRMTFETFEKRLKIIKDNYDEIDRKINRKLLDDLGVLFDDLNGVPASWLTRIVDNHLATLFMSVNSNLTEEKALEEAEYYVWENDFGGVTEISCKSYDLSDDKQLYDYLIKEF